MANSFAKMKWLKILVQYLRSVRETFSQCGEEKILFHKRKDEQNTRIKYTAKKFHGKRFFRKFAQG